MAEFQHVLSAMRSRREIVWVKCGLIREKVDKFIDRTDFAIQQCRMNKKLLNLTFVAGLRFLERIPTT